MTQEQTQQDRGQLRGKIALVTGGTTGIGRATAQRFYEEGAQVVVTGKSAASLDLARRQLPQDVVVLRSDAASIEDSSQLAEEIKRRFGALDVAFLNAGIAKLSPFEHVDEAHYTEQMDTNVKGVVFTLLKLLPLLRAGSSVIVNTSVANSKGTPNMAIYAATKGALSALVRTLAVELAPKQIRINSISPAMIHTAIQGKFGLPPAMQQAVAEQYTARIPLGRFGEAREVAQLAVFLAGEGASYINGVEVAVDGGLTVA